MVHITSDVAGMYSLELTASNINFLGNARICFTDPDVMAPVWEDLEVVHADYRSILFSGGPVSQTDVETWSQTGAAAAITADAEIDSILEDTGTTIPGTITTMQGNVTDILTDTGTTLPASIAAISTSGAAWGSTTVASPSSTTVFTITDGVTEDSVYVGFLITVTDADGDNLPEPAFVKSYVSSTKTITLSTPLSFTPANADTVSFLAGFGRGSGVTIFRRKGL